MFKHEDIPKFEILEILGVRGVPDGSRHTIRFLGSSLFIYTKDPSSIDRLSELINDYVNERFGVFPWDRTVPIPEGESSWCRCRSSYHDVDTEFIAPHFEMLSLIHDIEELLPECISRLSWFNKYYTNQGTYIGPANLMFRVESIEGPLDMSLLESMPRGGTLQGVSNLQNLRRAGRTLRITQYGGYSLPSLEEVEKLELSCCFSLTSAPNLKRCEDIVLEQTPLFRVHPDLKICGYLELHLREMRRVKSLVMYELVEELPLLKKYDKPAYVSETILGRIPLIKGSSYRMAEAVLSGLVED